MGTPAQKPHLPQDLPVGKGCSKGAQDLSITWVPTTHCPCVRWQNSLGCPGKKALPVCWGWGKSMAQRRAHTTCSLWTPGGMDTAGCLQLHLHLDELHPLGPIPGVWQPFPELPHSPHKQLGHATLSPRTLVCCVQPEQSCWSHRRAAATVRLAPRPSVLHIGGGRICPNCCTVLLCISAQFKDPAGLLAEVSRCKCVLIAAPFLCFCVNQVTSCLQ